MRNKQKGFSLIELLIVVAIILIIAAIAIPNLLRARIAANESSAVSSLRTMNTACITYNTSYGQYPTALTNLAPVASGTTTPTSTAADLLDATLTAAPFQKSGYTFTFGAGGGHHIHDQCRSYEHEPDWRSRVLHQPDWRHSLRSGYPGSARRYTAVSVTLNPPKVRQQGGGHKPPSFFCPAHSIVMKIYLVVFKLSTIAFASLARASLPASVRCASSNSRTASVGTAAPRINENQLVVRAVIVRIEIHSLAEITLGQRRSAPGQWRCRPSHRVRLRWAELQKPSRYCCRASSVRPCSI